MLLNNDLKCSVFDHIIFCWVMHEQSIIDVLLSHLDLKDVKVISISLVCQKEALEKEFKKISIKELENQMSLLVV